MERYRISLTLRRQNQYQYSPWVDDCMAILLKSPITDLDDMRLVEWTKLQRMAEEGLSVSGFNQGSTLDYTNVRTRYVLRSCMDRVVSWRHNLPNELVTG
jgi:hypothetical protein